MFTNIFSGVLVASALCIVTPVFSAEYVNTADKYPVPPIARSDFSPMEYVEQKGATAIFTIVTTEFGSTDKVQDEIRRWLPGAHVRRIISGTVDSDQRLMVMWRPKNAFRVDINDYYRVIDPLNNVIQTKTYVGVTDRHPKEFPRDTLIGWYGLTTNSGNNPESIESLKSRLSEDEDVLEVSEIAAGGVDLMITYRFSGRDVTDMLQTGRRIRSLINENDFNVIISEHCP